MAAEQKEQLDNNRLREIALRTVLTKKLPGLPRNQDGSLNIEMMDEFSEILQDPETLDPFTSNGPGSAIIIAPFEGGIDALSISSGLYEKMQSMQQPGYKANNPGNGLPMPIKNIMMPDGSIRREFDPPGIPNQAINDFIRDPSTIMRYMLYQGFPVVITERKHKQYGQTVDAATIDPRDPVARNRNILLEQAMSALRTKFSRDTVEEIDRLKAALPPSQEAAVSVEALNENMKTFLEFAQEGRSAEAYIYIDQALSPASRKQMSPQQLKVVLEYAVQTLRDVFRLRPHAMNYCKELHELATTNVGNIYSEDDKWKYAQWLVKIYRDDAKGSSLDDALAFTQKVLNPLKGKLPANASLKTKMEIATLLDYKVYVRKALMKQQKPDKSAEKLEREVIKQECRDAIFSFFPELVNAKQFERSLEENADHCVLSFILARMHFTSGEFPPARKYIRQAINSMPHDFWETHVDYFIEIMKQHPVIFQDQVMDDMRDNYKGTSTLEEYCEKKYQDPVERSKKLAEHKQDSEEAASRLEVCITQALRRKASPYSIGRVVTQLGKTLTLLGHHKRAYKFSMDAATRQEGAALDGRPQHNAHYLSAAEAAFKASQRYPQPDTKAQWRQRAKEAFSKAISPTVPHAVTDIKNIEKLVALTWNLLGKEAQTALASNKVAHDLQNFLVGPSAGNNVGAFARYVTHLQHNNFNCFDDPDLNECALLTIAHWTVQRMHKSELPEERHACRLLLEALQKAVCEDKNRPAFYKHNILHVLAVNQGNSSSRDALLEASERGYLHAFGWTPFPDIYRNIMIHSGQIHGHADVTLKSCLTGLAAAFHKTQSKEQNEENEFRHDLCAMFSTVNNPNFPKLPDFISALSILKQQKSKELQELTRLEQQHIVEYQALGLSADEIRQIAGGPIHELAAEIKMLGDAVAYANALEANIYSSVLTGKAAPSAHEAGPAEEKDNRGPEQQMGGRAGAHRGGPNLLAPRGAPALARPGDVIMPDAHRPQR